MDQKLPRYTVTHLGFVGVNGYAIFDGWRQQLPGMTEVLEKRYTTNMAAEKDCRLLNRAQKILSNLQ